MSTPGKGTSNGLWQHAPELAASSAFLLGLAEVATDRLSLTQAAFFMLAAKADAAGKPMTRTQLMDTYGEAFRGSIRNSYRSLLEPTPKYPKALGWLCIEVNQQDSREHYLRLTEEGRSVILKTLLALEALFVKQREGS